MNNIREMSDKERKQLLFVVSMWGINLFVYIRAAVERLPVINQLSDFFIPFTVIGIILYCFRAISKQIRFQDIGLVVGMAIIYLFHIVIYPQNAPLLEENASTFFIASLPFIFVGLVLDGKKHLPYMELVSMATLIIGVVYMSYKAKTGLLGEGDNTEKMGAAYYYLPHALLLLHTTIQRFSALRLSFFLLAIFIIMGTGNRGSLLVIATGAVLELLIIQDFKRPVLTKALITLVALLLFGYWESMVDTLFDLMERVGFSNRALRFVVEGEFIKDSNGRDLIAERLVEAIKGSPLGGYGLCGDRLLVGMYAHNLLLELLISFGILIGGVLILLVVYAIIRSYLGCKTDEEKGLWLILLSLGFIVLLISDSFLNNKFFFMMIGLYISLIRKQTKDKHKVNRIKRLTI